MEFAFLVKGVKVARVMPIASNLVKSNIKTVLLENFAKIANIIFSQDHILRLT